MGIGRTVYQDNSPDALFHGGDLANVAPRSFMKELGRVDLVLASPECTNHSPAKGAAERCEMSRETAFHVTRFAEAFRPRWVIVENVVNMKRWKRYGEFVDWIREFGHHCHRPPAGVAR